MRFKDVSTSCDCVSIKRSTDRLRPGETLALSFVAPVPERINQTTAQWRVRLVPDNKTDLEGIAIVFRYQVAGLLTFPIRRVAFETNAAKANTEFLVPMLITRPVEAKNLSVELPESLPGGTTEIISRNGQTFLKITLDNSQLERTYYSGEVFCIDTHTLRNDQINLVVRRGSLASIYPGVLRIAESSGREGFSASAIVRIQVESKSDSLESPVDASRARRGRSSDVIIEAYVDDRQLRLERTKLSDETYKVLLDFSPEDISALRQMRRGQVDWVVRTGSGAHRLKSAVTLIAEYDPR